MFNFFLEVIDLFVYVLTHIQGDCSISIKLDFHSKKNMFLASCDCHFAKCFYDVMDYSFYY